MKLWDAHAADRDRFTIVGIHDDRAKTFEELDGKLREKGILQRWAAAAGPPRRAAGPTEASPTPAEAPSAAGRNLPFPVLLDAQNATTKAYGVQFWPTTILIDPQGNLVRVDDAEAALEAALAGKGPAKRE